MIELTGEKLADLISKRHGCLVQLHRLGCKQTELIHSGEMSTLMRLLSAKNQLIIAMQAIERELTPFHAQDAATRPWHSPEARHACAQQAEACRELLEAVMQMEQENEQKLTQRRDQISQQLQSVQNSATARRAYESHQSKPQFRHDLVGGEATPYRITSQQLDLHTQS